MTFAAGPGGPGISRREMLKTGALLAAGTLLGAGCAPAALGSAPAPTLRTRPLARVRAEHDRVIRAVAGLRPFRPGGFVVRAEPLGEKIVIHNYGHGGGGITLSWGSAELAAELASETGRREFAVIGSGVMGLTTARRLQDRGAAVTIYTRDLPPNTTSNIAGGQWTPHGVFRATDASAPFLAQFERAARFAYHHFQSQVGPRYGVRWAENYLLTEDEPAPSRFGPALGPISDLFVDVEVYGPGEHPFPSRYAERRVTMLVEPAVFLEALTRDFLLRGGRIEVRAFRDRSELLTLPEPAIVNCTGLGARELFGDDTLTPIRGQLAILLPQPEVDYLLLTDSHYMFPRSDGIVLGGTWEPGVWSTAVEPEAVARIVDAHSRIFAAMQG